jgi:hypothetical protein
VLAQTFIREHIYFDNEDVTIYGENTDFNVDGVWYRLDTRNHHGSRFFTLKADYDEAEELFLETVWHEPMSWKPSGDPYWDNRSSP